MNFRLRGLTIGVFVFTLIMGGYLYSYNSLEAAQVKEEQVAKTEEPEQIKAWKLPVYMQENLQRMVDDFNKQFNEKVEAYKKELKARFVEFKDMPDDTILYLEGGMFIIRSDFLKLQEQLRDTLNEKPKAEKK